MNEKLTTQKDNLARLMAGEDLTVVHKRIPTAYFDVKNRVLACPIFKDDMSPELYDLFMGHEVGHALNTPYEGLHSTLEKNRTLKGYLNVVEDVRIEKAIKKKYPGLVKSFFAAYKELVAQDFFGIKDKDVNKLSLIDKINIKTKVGATAGVVFTAEELPFYEMAEACTTWEEVVECATAIYEWSKENETRDDSDEMLKQGITMPDVGDEEEGDESEDDYMEPNFDPNTGESEDEDGMPGEEDSKSLSEAGDDSAEGDEEGEEGEESGDGEEEGEEEGGQGDINPSAGQGSNIDQESYYDDSDGARESITEHNAHNNEGEFYEDAPIVRTTKDISNAFKKDGEIDNIVVGAEEIAEVVETFIQEYSDGDKWKELIPSMGLHTTKKILDKNKNLISHMAKEFEMKQNAMRSVKAFQGKTGKLDMNSIAKYQVMDDIFKRVTYLPDGKNHGVMVLLDWSGSIYGSVKNLLEQSLILAEFCKKVNIPYRIYAFSDQFKVRDDMIRGENVLLELFSDKQKKKSYRDSLKTFGILYNHYITSETRNWSKSEEIVDEWFKGLNVSYSWDRWDIINGLPCPNQLRLGGTPLNNSLVAMRKMLPEFKSAYQLEKMILTVITDGFSHDSNLLRLNREEREEMWENEKEVKATMEGSDDYWKRVDQQIFITDPYSKKQYPYVVPAKNDYYSRGYPTEWNKTANLLDWLQKETGVTVTGYFALEQKRDFYSLLNSCDDLRKHVEKEFGYDDGYRKTWGQIRKEGMVINAHGYGKLFLTCSAKLATVDDELSDDLIGAKKSTLLSNFKKNRNSKVTSRFLTNEFIKEIA